MINYVTFPANGPSAVEYYPHDAVCKPIRVGKQQGHFLACTPQYSTVYKSSFTAGNARLANKIA
jgi:hypothetical protein